MIRLAEPTDKKAIAELIYMVWRDMELEMVQHLEKPKVLSVIEDSITEVQYRSYYKHILIYEVEGHVAGCIISYDGSKELYYERQWNALNLDDAFKAFGTPLPIREAEDNERYIDTIATFEEYRGRGIATQLFEALIESDPDARWSLNVDKENPKALRLYERIGFEVAGEINLYGHDYYHMVYGGAEDVMISDL